MRKAATRAAAPEYEPGPARLSTDVKDLVRQVAAYSLAEAVPVCKTVGFVGVRGRQGLAGHGVPATCPIGGATADTDSHGLSRSARQETRRSTNPQVMTLLRHRLPKLTVQISEVWVADNRYAGGSVGVLLPPLPCERQGSATSSPHVGSINVQRCVGAGNLLTCDLSTSRRPARGHGYLAEDAAVRCRE